MRVASLTVVGLVVVTPCVTALPAVPRAYGGDWPQFRGPNGSATTTGKDLPVEWSADKNIAWKATLPGYGWSSPIIWGDKVFITTAVADKQKKPSGFGGGFGGGRGGFGGGGPGGGRGGQRPPDQVYQWQIYCLNAVDGKVIWKQTAAERKPALGISGFCTYATETPVTDGERIYAYFGMTGLFCYDFEGKQLWKADLGAYRMSMGHSTGSSPVLHDGRLFVQYDNEEKSFLVALDAKTGKELWRVKRTERTSWSTPVIWKNKMRTEVVCLSNPRARSYDPATGKQLWELSGLSGQVKATPAASADLLYLGSGGGFGGFGGRAGPGGGGGRRGPGGGKPLFAVKAGAAGDITLKDAAKSNDGVAWQLPQAGPSSASPLLYDGRLYVLEERGGIISCLDAKTGKQIYKERLQGARGFTSSPWAYDGKIFCLDDSGTTFVVKAGPEFKQLAKNPIDEMCWSSPAVGSGGVILRSVDHVYCIKQKTKEK